MTFIEDKVGPKPAVYKHMILTMEIVPETAWFFNLRKMFTQTMWDLVRNRIYGEFWYMCGMCGKEFWNEELEEWEIKKANGGGLHAHKIWHYNDVDEIQTCTGIIALCPTCHACKHMVLTQKRCEEGQIKMSDIIGHFFTVNQCLPRDFDTALEWEMKVYKERSSHPWLCDIGDYMEFVGSKSIRYIGNESLIGNFDLIPDKILEKVELYLTLQDCISLSPNELEDCGKCKLKKLCLEMFEERQEKEKEKEEEADV